MVLFTLLLALVFVLAGMARVQGLSASDVVRVRLGLPLLLWRFVGVVELTGALGLVVGATLALATGVAAFVKSRSVERPAPVLSASVDEAPESGPANFVRTLVPAGRYDASGITTVPTPSGIIVQA